MSSSSPRDPVYQSRSPISDSDSSPLATRLITPYDGPATTSAVNTRIGSQRFLRWPLVIAICRFSFAVLYLLVRFLAHVFEGVYETCIVLACRSRRHGRRIHKQLKEAQSFEEWTQIARELDQVDGREDWKLVDESPYFDYKLLKHSIEELRACKVDRDFIKLARVLSNCLSRNAAHASINNQQLYRETYFGTKKLIDEFVAEVLDAVILLRDAPNVPLASKIGVMKHSLQAYGRTALCLSGGACMAYHHFGVVKALVDAKCLPPIISGASAGAMVACWVGVRTDDELKELLVPEMCAHISPCEESWWVRLNRLRKTGAIFDWKNWIDKTRVATKGDTTFLEAYKLTGRILNIAMTSSQKHAAPIVLNYLTAPNVVIWSAVLASSAIPMVLNPVVLHSKDEDGQVKPYFAFGNCWYDGSIKNDLPMAQISEMFNVNYFIVSQCNPHIIPFFFHHRGSSGDPTRRGLGGRFRGGFLSSMLEVALRLEMRKWLQIMGELELLPEFFGQDWRASLLQANSGNVTIYPSPPLSSWLRLVEDPSRADMAQYLRLGELSTWPRMCALSNHYAFEKVLAESLQLLESQQVAKSPKKSA